jgi:hypothetical protein
MTKVIKAITFRCRFLAAVGVSRSLLHIQDNDREMHVPTKKLVMIDSFNNASAQFPSAIEIDIITKFPVIMDV